MGNSVQRALGPMEVKGLDGTSKGRVHKLDEAEITLEMAKAQLGRAVQKTIFRTNSVLKDFGDPSQVKRVCDGDVSAVFARVWQRKDRRHQFIRALIEEESSITVKTVIEIPEEAA